MGLALEEPKEIEKVVQINEVAVWMDDMVQPYTWAQVLDYLPTPGGQGFVFHRAGVGSRC